MENYLNIKAKNDLRANQSLHPCSTDLEKEIRGNGSRIELAQFESQPHYLQQLYIQGRSYDNIAQKYSDHQSQVQSGYKFNQYRSPDTITNSQFMNSMLYNSGSSATSSIGRQSQSLTDSETTTNGLFFESPSKYVSLKKYNQLQQFTSSFSSKKKNSKSQTANSNSQNSDHQQQTKSDFFASSESIEKGQSMSKWFSELTLPDKSVVLTLVDKELVKLIQNMYIQYSEKGNGKFMNSQYPTSKDVDKYSKVKNYNLLFLKPSYKKGYEYTSSTLKQREDIEGKIVDAIRIISVNDDYDAFTLEMDLYENSTFFLEMMNIAQSTKFLLKELPIVKDSKKLGNSVLEKYNNINQSESNNSNNTNSRPYFTCLPAYTGEKLPQQFTLGQMLIFLIEKMINIQYQEYINKLTTQQSNFFFVEPKRNIFQDDMKLTNYWVSLENKKRDIFFKQITEIQQELITEDHLKRYQCSQIKEEDNETNEYSPPPLANRSRPQKKKNNLFQNESSSEDTDTYDEEKTGMNYNQSYYKNKGRVFQGNSDSDYDLEDQRPTNRQLSERANTQKFHHFDKPNDQISYFMNDVWKDRDNQGAKSERNNQTLPKQQKQYQEPQTQPVQSTNKTDNNNELLNSIQNMFFRSKMDIVTSGKDAYTQEKAYRFVKKLSTNVNLDIFINQKLKLKYFSQIYKILLDQCYQSIYADLLRDEQSLTSSNNVSSPNLSSSVSQTSNNNTNQGNNQQQNAKKNKKKKKKTNTNSTTTNSQTGPTNVTMSNTLTQQAQLYEESKQIHMLYLNENEQCQKLQQQQKLSYDIVKSASDMVQQSMKNSKYALSIDDQVLKINRKIEERKSLLTGEIMMDKYANDNSDDDLEEIGYQQVDITQLIKLDAKETNIIQSQNNTDTLTDTQAKSKKKNKKKRNKANKVIANSSQETKTDNNIQNGIQKLTNQGEGSSNINENNLDFQSDKIQIFSPISDQKTNLEQKINTNSNQIKQNKNNKSMITDKNTTEVIKQENIDGNPENSKFEQNSLRKIDNTIDKTQLSQDAIFKDEKIEIERKIDEEDEEDTQKVILEVAASICNSTILGVKDSKKKKNKKSTNKKETNQYKKTEKIKECCKKFMNEPNLIAFDDLVKNIQTVSQQNLQKPQIKKQADSQQQQQAPQQQIWYQNTTQEGKRDEDKNIMVNYLPIKQEYQDQPDDAPTTAQKQKKVVGFKIVKDLKQDLPQQVSQRKSSKGSSGNEDIIHQTTIGMIEDMFPTHQNDPSDKVKSIISEITAKHREQSPPQQKMESESKPQYQEPIQSQNSVGSNRYQQQSHQKNQYFHNNNNNYYNENQQHYYMTGRKNNEYKVKGDQNYEQQLVYQKKRRLSQKFDVQKTVPTSNSLSNNTPNNIGKSSLNAEESKYQQSSSKQNQNQQLRQPRSTKKQVSKQAPQHFDDYNSMFENLIGGTGSQQVAPKAFSPAQNEEPIVTPKVEEQKQEDKIEQMVTKNVQVNEETPEILPKPVKEKKKSKKVRKGLLERGSIATHDIITNEQFKSKNSQNHQIQDEMTQLQQQQQIHQQNEMQGPSGNETKLRSKNQTNYQRDLIDKGRNKNQQQLEYEHYNTHLTQTANKDHYVQQNANPNQTSSGNQMQGGQNFNYTPNFNLDFQQFSSMFNQNPQIGQNMDNMQNDMDQSPLLQQMSGFYNPNFQYGPFGIQAPSYYQQQLPQNMVIGINLASPQTTLPFYVPPPNIIQQQDQSKRQTQQNPSADQQAQNSSQPLNDSANPESSPSQTQRNRNNQQNLSNDTREQSYQQNNDAQQQTVLMNQYQNINIQFNMQPLTTPIHNPNQQAASSHPQQQQFNYNQMMQHIQFQQFQQYQQQQQFMMMAAAGTPLSPTGIYPGQQQQSLLQQTLSSQLNPFLQQQYQQLQPTQAGFQRPQNQDSQFPLAQDIINSFMHNSVSLQHNHTSSSQQFQSSTNNSQNQYHTPNSKNGNQQQRQWSQENYNTHTTSHQPNPYQQPFQNHHAYFDVSNSSAEINSARQQISQLPIINQTHSHYEQQQNSQNIKYRQDPATQIEEEFFEKLSNEIYSFQSSIKVKLKQSETERFKAFEILLYSVKQTYIDTDVQIQIYGSMATGLAIDSSDMDILVSKFYVSQAPIERALLILEMKKLHKQLNSLFCLESNSIIETATIPVIKLVIDLQRIRDNQDENNPGLSVLESKNQSQASKEKISEDMRFLKIDITFDDHCHENIENSYLGDGSALEPQVIVHMGIKCCEFIKQMLIDYPLLEPLAIVLKKFLAVHNLNSPFLGGLSSYGLIILIIAFLNNDFPQTYNDQYSELPSLGRSLAYFLYYYSKCFDPALHYINESMQIVPQYTYTSTLTIIDPLNLANNIGKSTYNFDQIKLEIGQAYDQLKIRQQKFTDGKLRQFIQHLGAGSIAPGGDSNDEDANVPNPLLFQVLNIVTQIQKENDTQEQPKKQESSL